MDHSGATQWQHRSHRSDVEASALWLSFAVETNALNVLVIYLCVRLSNQFVNAIQAVHRGMLSLVQGSSNLNRDLPVQVPALNTTKTFLPGVSDKRQR